MTQVLDEALAALRKMPPQAQDEIVRALIAMTRAMEEADRTVFAATNEDADAVRLWPRRRRPRGAFAS